MIGAAKFSEEDPPRFRWSLSRAWGSGAPALVCMCNPSDADGEINDPTIGRCNELFKALGYGGYNAVNWSPHIATDPKELARWCWNNPDEWAAIHDENLALIRSLSDAAAVRVVAWGNMITVGLKASEVLAALSLDGRHPLYCFGTTKNGRPKHPMARGKHRIVTGAPLIEWRAGQ